MIKPTLLCVCKVRGSQCEAVTFIASRHHQHSASHLYYQIGNVIVYHYYRHPPHLYSSLSSKAKVLVQQRCGAQGFYLI